MKAKLLLLLLLISSYSFSQWQSEGTAQFTNNSLDVDITTDANDVPYVAYSDITDGILHVKSYNGTSWIDVGTNATGLVSPTLISIAINPTTEQPWVAFRNESTNRIDVVKYDGTSWNTERSTLNNFDPKNKIILKFSPTGDALIATEKTGSAITNATFYLYGKRNGGGWTTELTSAMFSNCFDIQSYDKVSFGFPYRFNNWRPRLHTYTYSSSTWSLTTNTGYTPSGGVNAYMFSLSAANDKILHQYNEQRNWYPINSIYLNGGANPPSGASPTKRVCDFEFNKFDYKSYGLFYDSSENLVVQEYDQYQNTWANLNIDLNFSGVDPKTKLEVSQTGSKVYVAYLDNSKVSVQYITATAPVSEVFVNLNASGNNDGTSWTDAYTNLQTAIDNTSFPTQIWVAQGTYKPVNNTGQKATFLVENTIAAIYGGFNGTETELSQRDFRNNLTILSGDLDGDDNNNILDTETTRSDNSNHVVSLKGKGSGTIIDGFTISDGNANGVLSNACTLSGSEQDHGARGGAIYAQAYSNGSITATIKNCILENNSGSDTGVYATLNPCGHQSISVDVNFESCIVRNNYSGVNSAFLFAGGSTYSQFSKGSIVNSLFYKNTSLSSASSVYLGSGTGVDVEIINSTFSNNTGKNGNVIKMVDASKTSIKNSIIYGNGSILPFDITTSASVISNSIVQGLQVSSATSADPLFTDAANDDYTLQSTSPALDTADSASLPTDITEDIRGNTRITNGGLDMGAYELTALQFTLTSGNLNGTITTDVQPTNGVYDYGTVVELTATPGTGYQFDGWSGDVTGTTNPLSVTMDANKSITPIFSVIQQTLTTIATNGTVVADVAPVNGTYDYNTAVILTATPNTGYQFDGWSGDVTSTTNPLSVTMDVDKNITATFSLIQQTLTTTAINGTISPSIQPINGTYDYSSQIILTATPNVGYKFDGWSGDATGTSNSISVTMDVDKNITAMFSILQQTLDSYAINGTITADIKPTNGTYEHGTVVTLTATPDIGYQFDGWYDDGNNAGTTNTLLVTMDDYKEIDAVFSLIQHTLTTDAVNGDITIGSALKSKGEVKASKTSNDTPKFLDVIAPETNNGQTYNFGTEVILTATPDAGYIFDGWSGDATGTTNPLTITMDADKNITAIFSVDDDLSVRNSTIDGLKINIENQTIKTNLKNITINIYSLLGEEVGNQYLNGLYIVLLKDDKGNNQIEKILITE